MVLSQAIRILRTSSKHETPRCCWTDFFLVLCSRWQSSWCDRCRSKSQMKSRATHIKRWAGPKAPLPKYRPCKNKSPYCPNQPWNLLSGAVFKPSKKIWTRSQLSPLRSLKARGQMLNQTSDAQSSLDTICAAHQPNVFTMPNSRTPDWDRLSDGPLDDPSELYSRRL